MHTCTSSKGQETLVKLKHRNYLTSRNTIEYSAYKIINGCNTMGGGGGGGKMEYLNGEG